MTQVSNKFDLEERTAIFGEKTITLCKLTNSNVATKIIVDQLIRSSTSVGANYMEANGASSKKDFRNKAYICKKEAQESKHWLRMLATAQPELKEKTRILWQEAHELTLIFQKITSSLNNKS